MKASMKVHGGSVEASMEVHGGSVDLCGGLHGGLHGDPWRLHGAPWSSVEVSTEAHGASS